MKALTIIKSIVRLGYQQGTMAEKGNNGPFKSPRMGQPGWVGGDLFFCLSDMIQKCEPRLPRAASLLVSQWEDENLSLFFSGLKSHKCLVPIVWELILDIVPLALPTSSQ